MKKLFKVCVLWFTINSLFVACRANKKKATIEKAPETTIAQPAPLQDAKTDSLKNYLDAERAKRRK